LVPAAARLFPEQERHCPEIASTSVDQRTLIRLSERVPEWAEASPLELPQPSTSLAKSLVVSGLFVPIRTGNR
jgi:hypothetical protein